MFKSTFLSRLLRTATQLTKALHRFLEKQSVPVQIGNCSTSQNCQAENVKCLCLASEEVCHILLSHPKRARGG